MYLFILNKDDTVSAKANLVDSADTNNNLSNKTAVIKGRGNFTWTLEKRPYQIKFDSKTSVLGMAPSKTWVLLANHVDRTLSRSSVIFDLADEMGLAYSSESRFVDLYINGEYLGNYLICEKPEVGSTRVALTNPDGLLLEMDNHYGTVEPYYFKSKISGTVFVLKDSFSAADSVVAQQAFSNIESDINTLESLLDADHPDWDAISSMIDVDSFVKRYFVEEFAMNSDVGYSSMFFYKDGSSDKLHAGPVWDYDLALGNLSDVDKTADYVKNIDLYNGQGGYVRNDWYLQLCRNEEFVTRVNELYSEQIGTAVDNANNNLVTATNLIQTSAKNNFVKWPVLGQPVVFDTGGRVTESSFSGEVSYLKNWISERADYLDGAYGSDMPVLKYSTQIQNVGWQPSVTTGMKAGTTGQSLSLEALNLSILDTGLSGTVECSAHVQNIGWQNYVGSGSVSGTTGQSLGIEAVKIKLTDTLADNYDIYYRVHSQNYGWLGWAKNDEIAGTVGKNLRAESIQIKIVKKGTIINNTANHCVPAETAPPVPTDTTPPILSDASISNQTDTGYQVNVKATDNVGISYVAFATWTEDGGQDDLVWQKVTVGTDNMYSADIKTTDHNGEGGTYITHIYAYDASGNQVGPVVLTTEVTDGIPDSVVNCSYQTHVQNIGWQGFKSNGALSGTTGQSLRLEGIEIKTDESDLSKLGVTYQTHVQNIGWQGFVNNGEISGTTGQSLRLEGIQIKLTGTDADNYDIYYQVHAQNYGWLGWAKNGESAGTEGLSLRLEAIKIVVVTKGSSAPGSTDQPFVKN